MLDTTVSVESFAVGSARSRRPVEQHIGLYTRIVRCRVGYSMFCVRVQSSQRSLLRLRTGHQRHANCRHVAARSQPFTELKPWQRKRLEAAAELSKKKTNVRPFVFSRAALQTAPWPVQLTKDDVLRDVQVREIAGDLEMSREEVLFFVNWLRKLPQETRESMRESREAAESALAEIKQLRQQKDLVDGPAEKLTFQGDASLLVQKVLFAAELQTDTKATPKHKITQLRLSEVFCVDDRSSWCRSERFEDKQTKTSHQPTPRGVS